jgi:tRNA nucleotidyltransferase/poly(A) polymerase
MQMYQVGGAVRDELLGVPSKDIDFTVVLSPEDCSPGDPGVKEGKPWFTPHDPFIVMGRMLRHQGFEIFLETPEFLTIRARFPKGSEHSRLTADFVLARKESDYTDGRRPDVVVPGTLEDDLARRDFTMNAIAKDGEGNLIDPHGGISDIKATTIRAVGDPMERLTEDALRALRAVRFSVTKGFGIDMALEDAMESIEVLDAIRDKISDERIAVELQKMFRFNTKRAGRMLFFRYPNLGNACFAGDVSLDATMKTKGRGRG